MNVTSFDSLLKYTPNVTYSGNGPGTGNIFMRGLSSGGSGNQSQSTTAPFPNVALYLDDQSMQFPARNNDVYLVDMERVEVLEGPQGTLFGGGAQAGAIRYITNKPKLDVTEGDVNASYGITAGGDPNSSANATINIPVIPDTLAVRATIFTDNRGGYISNVPGTIASIVQPAVTASNANLVASNTNTQSYTGIRAGALLKFNEDWNLLLQQNYQNMQADGYWGEYPTGVNGAALGNYQIQAFTPAYDKDKYESTSWTLNGRFGNFGDYGDLKFVYTGSYLDRHIQAQQDYSNYLRSGGWLLLRLHGRHIRSRYGTTKPQTCYAPVGSWEDTVENTHQSHEVRLSTSEDNRIRGLIGGYWEDFIIKDQMNFNYLPIPQCDAANLAISLGGRTRLYVRSRTHSGKLCDRSQPAHEFRHRLRRRRQARLPASCRLHVRRCGSDSPCVDRDRRDPLFPLRRVRTGFGVLLRYVGRQCGQRCLHRVRIVRFRHQLEQAGARLQEPRQHHLAHHAGHDGCTTPTRRASGRAGSIAPRPPIFASPC